MTFDRARILNLLTEAETLRIQLVDILKPVEAVLSTACTTINTAETSPVHLTSLSADRFDMNSPAASTIYLNQPKSLLRRASESVLSPELESILSTVNTVTHRRALIAIEKHGIEAVKWKRGFTALHWAEKIERDDIIEFLLKRGADATAQDDDGLIPRDYRKKRRIDEMVKLKDMPESHRKCLEAISRHGWSNMKWAGGWTIMHWAFQEGRDDVIFKNLFITSFGFI